MNAIQMYRPVGPIEMQLLRENGFKFWPDRLPDQPIFYPVTNEAYACEIAERWNVNESGFGAVTRFAVDAEFMARYSIQRVGAKHHTEWWIPADQLAEFNSHIIGLIEVIREFGQRT